MAKPEPQVPPLPTVGYPESYYAREAHRAEKAGDRHLHEGLKVAQYVTLALDPRLSWRQKLRYFQHALRRHCNPPNMPGEQVWLFYRSLAHLVREHCGREALRLASEEDDRFADRVRSGQPFDRIAPVAHEVMLGFTGADDRCPDHYCEEDWAQLRILRDQWAPRPQNAGQAGGVDARM